MISAYVHLDTFSDSKLITLFVFPIQSIQQSSGVCEVRGTLAVDFLLLSCATIAQSPGVRCCMPIGVHYPETEYIVDSEDADSDHGTAIVLSAGVHYGMLLELPARLPYPSVFLVGAAIVPSPGLHACMLLEMLARILLHSILLLVRVPTVQSPTARRSMQLVVP